MKPPRGNKSKYPESPGTSRTLSMLYSRLFRYLASYLFLPAEVSE